jgi:hypothetical protein
MSVFPSRARALGSLVGPGHRTDVGHEGSPHFSIRDVAVASHEGSSTRCQLLIEEAGGACSNVGVMLGSESIKALTSLRAGQSRKVTLTFGDNERPLIVRIVGSDANGSFCKRTFRGATGNGGTKFS